MKCIVLMVLAFATALSAFPYPVPNSYPPQFIPLDNAATGVGNSFGAGSGSGLGTEFGIREAGAIGNGALGFSSELPGGLANPLNRGLQGGASFSGVIPGVATGSRYVNDRNYAGQQYDAGAGGFGNQAEQKSGGSSFHDVGSHKSSVTSVTKTEQTDTRDVSSNRAFGQGTKSNVAYNGYQNGAAQAGIQLNAGGQRQGVGLVGGI